MLLVSPYRPHPEAKGLAKFVNELGEEVGEVIAPEVVSNSEQGEDVEIGIFPTDHRDQSYDISWNYNDKHGGGIAVYRHPFGSSELVIIYSGVRSVLSHSGQPQRSSPKELRNAAQIHENVQAFLRQRFGDGSSHGRGTTYWGKLEEVAETGQPAKA